MKTCLSGKEDEESIGKKKAALKGGYFNGLL